MQLKITLHFILFACLTTSLRGKALYRKGCCECEEEVWEEVPCDEIPSNSTTVSTTYYSSTPTYKPTTPIPKPTTNIPTTVAPTTMKYKSTTISPPITTPYTTTIIPEYTTAKDTFKKCYCECKLGCKEFCRKVVMNSPDKQIVQVSKMSVPVEKGRIESTHFLQRELIPKTDHSYNSNHDHVSTYDEEPDSDKYEASTLPPAAYAAYHDKPNVPSTDYYSKPIPAPIKPIYDGSYATAEAGVNNFRIYASYPPNPPHPPYYSPPSSSAYNFPIPIENAFSKVSKAILDPVESIKISLDASRRKIGNPTYSKCPSYSSPSYSSPTPVKDSQLESSRSLGNALNFDDSFDSLIKEFISNNPSNEIPYQVHPKPFYSVSYSR